ncbi:MAG TPA: DUF4114 domain-containing protein [Terriglobales bacterium]|nr:DUF4114 domain-containing protein [Terriglobales bacterium]
MASQTLSSSPQITVNSSLNKVEIPNIVQLAQADGTPATNGAATPTGQPATPVIPGVPNGEIHVDVPAGQTVTRVQVAPGETIDIPFGSDLAARFGEQGNLAIKSGDETIIFLGYAAANQENGVTLHNAQGQVIDVASVVAQTDPNLDIQTAAGGGHLFFGFNPGAGLNGFGEIGVIDPTALQYKLIQPDEFIRPFDLANNNGTDETLSISTSDGSVTLSISATTVDRDETGSAATGDYLASGGGEGKAISSSLMNKVDSTNLLGTTGTQVSVTLDMHATSANENLVGVYEYDSSGNIVPGSVKFIWLDTNATDLLGNAQQSTVNLGSVAPGDKLGFFIVDLDRFNTGATNADTSLIKNATGGGGHGYDTDLASLNSVVSIDPVTHQILINGVALKSQVYFSSDQDGWNSDGKDHTISGTSSSAPGDLFIGFEDRNFAGKGGTKADGDYNDVIFSVHVTDTKSSEVTTFVQPQITLADTSNITEINIDTTGFLVGDSLTNLASGSGFVVAVTTSGNDEHVTITETTGHTTAEWETFVNGIHFDTTSTTDGERDVSYTVTDSAGHTASSTAKVDVVTQYADELSTESAANHPGANLLHDGATAGHDVAWGAGNDTLMLDQNFASNDGHLDMGTGDNTLSVAANGLNITSSDTSHVSNVDHVDTTGFGANTVTLDAADVISMADSTTHTLRFDGDAGTDSVALSGDGAGPGGWHELSTAGQSITVNGTNYTTNASGEVVIGGQTYDAYQWHADGNVAGAVGATVLINHALDVTSHVNVTDQI